MAETASEDERAQEMERKKALLVYKSNQHSASDDDDDEEDEDMEHEEEAASVEDDGDEEDARSVRSEAVSVEEEEEEGLREEEDDEEEEEEEEEGGEVDEDDVQVEKDDDESVNAPSDDDLDSTATPRHDTEDDEEEDAAEEDDTEDSATESKASQPAEDGAPADGASKPAASTGASSSGSKLNVEEIIAARRRTGARKECEVCHEGRNGRRAMLCATCKTMYHSSCYRKKYSKLITAMGKQWFCPDCEPVKPASPEKSGDGATPRKKKGVVYDDGRSSAKLSAKDLKNARSLKASSKGHRDSSSMALAGSSLPGDGISGLGVSSSLLVDQELKRVTEIAMRSARKINALIIERTDEMLYVTQSLSSEIEGALGSVKAAPASSTRSILHHDEGSLGTGPLPPLSALTMVSSSEAVGGVQNGQSKIHELEARDAVLRSVQEGLFSLKNMLEQLQVMGIQSEVDLIRDIKVPPVKEEPKATTTNTTTNVRKSSSGAAAARTAAALSAAAKREAKPGASRLYSAKQIQKLEEWYQKSSRPEASEIQAMYRIINSPEYADKELQPDGISVKQIRIWFDNRRAKERLDYMRLKMKDISTADMDAEDVKRMKAAYIDEAKEVLEARVSRLKENGKTVPLIDAADTLLLQSSERPLPTMSKTSKASPASKAGGGLSSFSSKDEKSSSLTNQKKRIRIDYVASVRKAVKDARDAGKSEDEIKLIKTAAIERARERLHVPYKNARLGPTKPLGKEEVTHVKMTMLKLLEEDAPAEELTDVVELLLSVIIPHDILVESQLHRQLGLVLKAHKDNKELVKQTNKLLDEFNTIIEKGDDATLYDDETSVSGGSGLLGDDDKVKGKKKGKKDSTNLLLSVDSESLPGTPGASPDSPGASPDARKARVKFSRDQLMKLERHFHKEDTPSKKNLEKLSKKLNDIASRDIACEGQDRIDYKQIRSWFYKRRSTNQPPQALSQADLREIEAAGTASSSSSASETESDSNDEATPAAAPSRSKNAKGAKEKASSAASKRKASEDKPTAASKRQKKTDAAPSEAKTPARPSKKETGAAAGAGAAAAAAGKQHSGRIFNVKQLATIIEEYEKNPRPTVERLEELQRILNLDDHADDNFVNPLGVTKRQIKTWFSNRRAKERLEVIRMKVQTTDSSSKGKSSSKSKATTRNDSGASGSDDDVDDEDDGVDEEQSKKKPAKASSAAASSSAKKELFSASGDAAAASRHVSDDDLSDDNDDDDDDDDDVDMGSDDDDDDVEKDSDDDKDDDDDDKDSDDDDDSDSDDGMEDTED